MDKKARPNKGFLNNIPEQLVRLFFVVVILVVGVLLVRAFVVPKSIKESELHRAKTLQAEISRKGKYSDTEVCVECHDEENNKILSGFHKFLSCETCHGAGGLHVEEPGETPPSAPRKRDYCAFCHSFDPSRPTGFPQINPIAHNPMKPCISCHDPHAPKPPEVPKECSACHGEISRTMSLSPHVQLSCVTCHKVPGNHKTAPRAERPSKPEKREFCGKCHAKASSKNGTPKVDMAAHGEKYLCWQCHYPHLPETG
jgi:DnaJ-class molecular chaperone